jgi:hypothetical protein
MTAVVLTGVLASQAHGSGYGQTAPWYLDTRGGDARDLQRLYAGQQGVVMARSSRTLLFLNWRLLHGREVGPVAGPALAGDCCEPPRPFDPDGGVYAWLEARKVVPDAPAQPAFLSVERDIGNYQTQQNCFKEAFDTAAATLADRAKRYGAGSPAVRAWLDGQDAVFKSCHDEGVEMPPMMPDQPGWLRADRAYQSAALALYNGFNDAAAERFADIARDPNSPWRPMGQYLRVRAIQREALAKPGPASFARSRAAIADLSAAPDGTYGKSQVRGLLRVLDYRDRPDQTLATLDRDLNRQAVYPEIAIDLRDYLALGAKAAQRPEAVDWIETLKALDAAGPADHARERWTQTRDVAWLLAALALVSPDDPAAEALAADAARVPAGPAWLNAQYHRTRLTIAKAPAAETRARLDRILARKDLSSNDRALFTAARLQVAADLNDFARHASRRHRCKSVGDVQACEWGDITPVHSQAGYVVYDGPGSNAAGFGEDARAIIDRMPLAQRIALSRNAALPAPLRLDVALTSFARAVQLQDDAAIDALSRDLAGKLPQMKTDWNRIAAAPSGPDKRFAAYFAMAKIPGLRTDLIDYPRPVGTVANFRGYWTGWSVMPRGQRMEGLGPPRLATYQMAGYLYGDGDYQNPESDALTDLTCLGECGPGAFPLRLPNFVASGQGVALAERGRFFKADGPSSPPKGSRDAWEEVLAYARAHPSDPRSPEALYWLIRITRWGPNENGMSKRAFTLLHARYPKSSWARRSPYHY